MRRKERNVETKNLAKPYVPTPHERVVAESYFARKEKSPRSPRMKVSMQGCVETISPDHPEAGIDVRRRCRDYNRDPWHAISPLDRLGLNFPASAAGTAWSLRDKRWARSRGFSPWIQRSMQR
jgi:hypothetical protein